MLDSFGKIQYSYVYPVEPALLDKNKVSQRFKKYPQSVITCSAKS